MKSECKGFIVGEGTECGSIFEGKNRSELIRQETAHYLDPKNSIEATGMRYGEKYHAHRIYVEEGGEIKRVYENGLVISYIKLANGKWDALREEHIR